PLAVQMQPGLDLEGGVLVDDTGGARLELRAVGVAPPACRAPLSVEFGASGIESMREVVGEVDADATVELRVLGVGAVADGQEKAGRQDDLVELRVDVGERRRGGQLPDVAVGGNAHAPAVLVDVEPPRGGDADPEPIA